MKVIIPSYKRPDRVITADYLPEAYICVSPEEKDAYAANYGADRLIVLDGGVQGNIARVRNWILDHVKGDIVMIDDDIDYIGMTEHGERVKLSGDEVMALFERGFILAEDLGAYLWGFNVQDDRMFYREYTPFSLQSPVLATVCCIRENPLRYDERIPLKEDYDYFLQHIKTYRKVLRMNKYHYHTKHLIGSGGCIAYRTMDREKECAELLQRKWGSKVVKLDFERSINPIIKSPLKGV